MIYLNLSNKIRGASLLCLCLKNLHPKLPRPASFQSVFDPDLSPFQRFLLKRSSWHGFYED